MVGFFVYVLIDPRTTSIRYVGKTKNTSVRQLQHEQTSWKDETHNARWLAELRRENLTAQFLVVEICEDEISLGKAEARWQARCWCLGLTNEKLEDGNGFIVYTQELHEKMSRIAKEVSSRPEVKANRSVALKKAHREKPEIAQKISAKAKLRKRTPEELRSWTQSQAGKPRSVETVAVMSKSAKSSWQNPEIRAKRSAGMKRSWKERKKNK